jgi:hypothetical protein
MAAQKKEATASSAKAGKGSSSARKGVPSKVSPDKVSKTPNNARKKNFRFRWMKKLPDSECEIIKIQQAETGTDNSTTSDTKSKAVSVSVSASKSTKAKAVNSSVTKSAKAKAVDESAKKEPVRGSPNKFEELLDFNQPANKPATETQASAPSTPRKFLFGPKPDRSRTEEKLINDTGNDSDDEQYNSDKYDFDSDYEHLPEVPIKHLPISPKDVHKYVGKDDPSVPKAINNIAKAKLRARATVPDPNGRKNGRKLVQWHRKCSFNHIKPPCLGHGCFILNERFSCVSNANTSSVGPRMMEKLLLFLEYECHQKSVEIPWDDIVHRLQPGSSGPSATQMLLKMRERLVVEGHMVPPEKTKPHIPPNPLVRGFVRKDRDPNGNPGEVRVVAWNEYLEHPKESIQNPGITCGSGKYTRGPDGRKSQSGARRSMPRLKLEIPEEYTQTAQKLKDEASAKKTMERRERAKRKRLAQRQQDAEENGDIADPAELSSDAEWDPKITKKPRRSTRTRKPSAKSEPKIEPMSEDEATDASENTSSMMQFGAQDEEESSTLPIKLSVAPEKLANFPAGQSGTPTPEPEEHDNDQAAVNEDNDQAVVDEDNATVSDVEQDEVAEFVDGEEVQADEYGDGEAQYQDQVTNDEDHFDPENLGSLQQYYSSGQGMGVGVDAFGTPLHSFGLHPLDDPFVDHPSSIPGHMSQPYGMLHRTPLDLFAPAASVSVSPELPVTLFLTDERTARFCLKLYHEPGRSKCIKFSSRSRWI